MSTDTLTPLWDRPETAQLWPSGVDRVVLDETDSTMAEARRRAPSLQGPTWILAKRQTAAHGRRGRAWSMPDGNFAATLVFRPNCDPSTAALRSFVAANALRLTFETWTKDLSLKWPNDVLLRGRKVAGILLESGGQGGHVDWLSIGIGVNLAEAPAPEVLESDATAPISLRDATNKTVPPEDFLFWLASHCADQERQFTTFGFEPIRELWLQHAARLGEAIRARTSTTEHHGTFETVDSDGNLVLTTAKTRLAIPAADVYF